MASGNENGVSKGAMWTGRIMSALPVLLVLFGAVTKVMKLAPVMEGMARAGLPARLTVPIGILELTCVIVYLIPRTSVLGAILLTGLLGGAVSTHVRAQEGLFAISFPVIFGAILW